MALKGHILPSTGPFNEKRQIVREMHEKIHNSLPTILESKLVFKTRMYRFCM